MSLVTPIAQVSYDKREEQNFREFVRRNLENNSNKISALTVELDAASLFVTPQQFGANADGVVDDLEAIASAITAAGVGGRVYFPKGTYAISDELNPLAGQIWTGDGVNSVLKQTGTNKHIIEINVSNVLISDISFYGHSDTGDGVLIEGNSGDYLENVTVRNCTFDYIGSDASSAGCIVAHYVRGVRVIDCRFLENNDSGTGADVGAGSASDVIITGCYSTSQHDAFASMGSVFLTENIRHTITNNIAVRTGEDARSGVIAVYNSMPGFVNVSGNIFEGFIWNGIYVQAAIADTDATAGSGGVTIADNIVRYCGGEGTITAGIYVSGTNGSTVTGNLVFRAGKKADNTDRTNDIQGIQVYQNSKGTTVNGNAIIEATGYGIGLSQGGTLPLQGTAIVGNSIHACEGGGIAVASAGAGGILNSVIANNTIQLTDSARGIFCDLTGTGVITGVMINHNLFETSAAANTGAELDAGVRGEIIGNTFSGFTNGVYFPGAAARQAPALVRVEGNTFKNCTVSYTSTGSAKFIVLSSTFISSGNGVSGSYEGNALGTDASGNLLVEILTDTNPASGTWYQGDRRSDLTPDASGFIGAVCVTAGSPGTWKTFGAISA